MANSVDEYWSIDGVSLHQFGWSVATVGGSRYDLPPLRGDNVMIAYRPGSVHRYEQCPLRDPRIREVRVSRPSPCKGLDGWHRVVAVDPLPDGEMHGQVGIREGREPRPDGPSDAAQRQRKRSFPRSTED